MSPQYNITDFKGPLPQIEPTLNEVLKELEQNCDMLVQKNSGDYNDKNDDLKPILATLHAVKKHCKRELDKYKINYVLTKTVTENYNLELKIGLPSWIDEDSDN